MLYFRLLASTFTEQAECLMRARQPSGTSAHQRTKQSPCLTELWGERALKWSQEAQMVSDLLTLTVLTRLQDTCHTLKTLWDTNPEMPGAAIPEGYTSVHICSPQRATVQWAAKRQMWLDARALSDNELLRPCYLGMPVSCFTNFCS